MKTTDKIKKRADELLSQMTLKEKLQIIIETSPENKRLGIPKYYHYKYPNQTSDNTIH